MTNHTSHAQVKDLRVVRHTQEENGNDVQATRSARNAERLAH